MGSECLKRMEQEEGVADMDALQGSEYEVQNISNTRQGLFAHLINWTTSAL